MLALYLMLLVTYYAFNYATIIGLGLMGTCGLPDVCTLSSHVSGAHIRHTTHAHVIITNTINKCITLSYLGLRSKVLYMLHM